MRGDIVLTHPGQEVTGDHHEVHESLGASYCPSGLCLSERGRKYQGIATASAKVGTSQIWYAPPFLVCWARGPSGQQRARQVASGSHGRPGYGYDPRRLDVPLGRHGHGYHHTSMVHFAHAETAHDASQPVDDLLHYNMDDHAQTNRADDAHLDDQTQANRPDDARVDQLEQALHFKGPDPAGHTLDHLHHEDIDGPHDKHSSAPQHAHPARPVDHLHLVEALRLHNHTAGLHLLAPRLDDNKLLDQALDDGGASALLHPLVGLHHDQRLVHSTLHAMVAVVFRDFLPELVDALHEHRLSHRELLAYQEQDDGHGHADGYQAFRHLAG
ncbi:hypothetical protein LTS16_024537 [Friedmanniomyces endolithicus]|nr:hypothetical protein LTR75_009152 [Friedmanniomyces endolithicus]KAK0827580.1 hypothetical protein LTR03_016833 [Friedmanniomyces endolithicus]KAK0862018.1 hypothetical protein LTR87_016748 [Friedmanniomyces endolithicus]KAK0892741.1 hypothetical protein LTR57_024260 [Friedmanniomyces endolithicus]KAK1023850.1 hypothetical protein LTS16_024537 [Friedmanniomyces endolithicus]